MTVVPEGLAAGGEGLWVSVHNMHALDPVQLVTLELACRQRDRADSLAAAAAAGDAGALRHERDASLAMARLLVAVRLPDEAGKRPQFRPGPGVKRPTKPSASLDERLRRIS